MSDQQRTMAVLGAGDRAGQGLLAALLAVADRFGVTVTAVADRDPERARRLVAGFGNESTRRGHAARGFRISESVAERFATGARVFGDYETCVERAQPDGVLVLAPATDRHESVLSALRAGCHLFLAPPTASRLEEAIEIGELARAYRRRVTVGYPLPYQLSDLVSYVEEDNAVGRIRLSRISWTLTGGLPTERHLWDRPGGGALSHLGGECAATLMQFHGDAPAMVQAERWAGAGPAQFDGFRGDDSFKLAVAFRNGTHAEVDGAWALTWPEQITPTIGSTEVVALRLFGRDEAVVDQLLPVRASDSLRSNTRSLPATIYRPLGSDPKSDGPVPWRQPDALLAQMHDWLTGWHGAERSLTPLALMLGAERIVDAALRSAPVANAGRGEWVPVEGHR